MDDGQIVEILMVEDTPSDAKLAIRALSRHNLANHIRVVKDGAEALDFLFCQGQYAERLDHQPKLILLDLNLPKVSGLEVLRQIKENPETQMLPVVVLTSSREDRDLDRCYRMGVNSYIVKPVDFEQFTKAVGEIGLYWILLNEAPESAISRHRSHES